MRADVPMIFRRSSLTVHGEFILSTVLRRPAIDAVPVGVTLGASGTDGRARLAFMIGPQGVGTSTRPDDIDAAEWTPTPLSAPVEGYRRDRLELRVTSATVAIWLNGRFVRSFPVAAGEVDGIPGVYVGAGGDVWVEAVAVSQTPQQESLL